MLSLVADADGREVLSRRRGALPREVQHFCCFVLIIVLPERSRREVAHEHLLLLKLRGGASLQVDVVKVAAGGRYRISVCCLLVAHTVLLQQLLLLALLVVVVPKLLDRMTLLVVHSLIIRSSVGI